MRLNVVLLGRVGKWTKAYANLPDEYIERKLDEGRPTPIRGVPQFRPRPQKQPKPWFSLQHPWDAPVISRFRKGHAPVKPVLNWNYFPGDIIQVLEGKDKGKVGEVKAVFEERNWVLVEGLNLNLIFMPGTEKHDPMYIEQELPFIIDTEVSLIDPKTKLPTGIEWRYTEEGERVRVSLATETIIPIPDRAMTTVDYIKPENYVERSKDTNLADLQKVTFKPALKTFEMDIMEKMGITEDRIPKKYYWY